jgi:hypothetical protein
MNLQLELITGDVNQIGDLDFLLLGHKNPLRRRICEETSSVFQPIDSESWSYPHQYEFLEEPSYKWKRVAAIKFRSNGKISETQFVRISSPISTALKQPDIRSIGILPPTWHNPSYCALGIIYSLWLLGYVSASGARSPYPEVMKELFPSPAKVKFKIISQTGTEDFENVLKNDCDVMWKFFKQLQKKELSWTGCSYKSYRKVLVRFEVTKMDV